MSLVTSPKVALMNLDDKRYYISNCVSVGYGHPLCSNVKQGEMIEECKSISDDGEQEELIMCGEN